MASTKQEDTKPAPRIQGLVKEEREREEARRLAVQQETDEVASKTEVHTYPDGSQRVGVPPFPEKSPLEEAAELGTDESGPGSRPMDVPRGMKQSGSPVAPAGGVTESQFVARASEQLTSDVTSGKDPGTINPTTASDKPELRYMTGENTGDDERKTVISDEPTQEELDAIAAKIEPKGNIEATEEEKRAAVLQVAREQHGPVLADEKATKKK